MSLKPQITGESSKRPQLLEGLGVTNSERGSLPFDGVLGNVTIQELTTSYKNRLSTGETTKSRKGPVGREKAITLYTWAGSRLQPSSPLSGGFQRCPCHPQLASISELRVGHFLSELRGNAQS